MALNQETSVEQLRRQSERTRSELTHTVSELREKVSGTVSDLKTRISPKHIKEEAKSYVRESSEQLFNKIERKARENPLQAVAIGAGLAYPLWGLLRRIPAPILLVGAGLFLAKKDSANYVASKSGELATNATDRVSDFVSTAQDAMKEGSNQAAEAVATAGAVLSSSATSITDRVMGTASDAKFSLAELGQNVVDTFQETAASATETVSQTTAEIKDRAVEIGAKSRSAIIDIADRNPLLIAGVGLAIGAFIAASLPPSDAENRMFGDRSDDLRDKARDAASQGLERAKELASGVASDVADAADRQGLNPDGVQKAVERLAESVKSVADRGVQAAMGEENFSPSQTSTHPHKS